MRPIIYIILLTLGTASADQWPYNRYAAKKGSSGKFQPDKTSPEFTEPAPNDFIGWLVGIANNDPQFRDLFPNGSVPTNVSSAHELLENIEVPNPKKWFSRKRDTLTPKAQEVLSNLGYPLDPRCTLDKANWWYRTYDGSCNWLKVNEIGEGQAGTAKVRDYNQYSYADGISKPREGPNPRAVSNAFFKRNATIYYEHTPLLLGLIEFIIHDISYSQDSDKEYIDVDMPPDETEFYPNTTLRVWRTEAVPGTGESKPRENINMATTWLDLSSLYGSTPRVGRALRSFTRGKLLTQERVTRGRKVAASYLPFNTMDVPTRTRPGVNISSLFAGGDPRTNEDWLMLGVHTLLLREHNRLCDILAKKHPEYDDEQLYQTVRVVMSAKYAMIANSYQMAYWTEAMPWPRDDGFPLFRQMYGESILEINPAATYPWPLVTKNNRPMVVSAEMAIVYRFHEFIIPSFPVKDAANETLWEQNVFETGFDAEGFIDAGVENVLRGMVATHIPNFKSGVDESFRTANKYRGNPFDIVTWSIVHEREQGLPTFNQYFRAYNNHAPEVKVKVPIRDTFENFSSNPEIVAKLRALYKSPDEVDLVVGCQLDEQYFPGTTVPKSSLIISLFSLFGMGNSDRFSIGFAVMRCILVDKPWDCHPSNALEDLIWKRKESAHFPHFRTLDTFWLKELDLQAHGSNLLWRLITENTDIQCVQQRPLFPADKKTNPILCAPPDEKFDLFGTVVTGFEVVLALTKMHWKAILATLAAGAIILYIWKEDRARRYPPVMKGWPVIGKALDFQKDPKSLLLKGFKKYGTSAPDVFGIKLARLTYFVITDPRDLNEIQADNPYEVTFSLHGFLSAINFALITQKDNFETDVHTKLIRAHLGSRETLREFLVSIDEASRLFLDRNPLSGHQGGLNAYINSYITFVVSYCIVGPDGFDDPTLLDTFLKFNDDAVRTMGISSLVSFSPKFIQTLFEKVIEGLWIKRHLRAIRKVLLPVISKTRKRGNDSKTRFFLPFILDVIDDDSRASDVAAIVVWGGLTNLQATFSSTLLDIINEPNLQDTMVESLKKATTQNLDAFAATPEWALLRSAMFESVRLSGSITGPARLVIEEIALASDPSYKIPSGQVATLSSYYTHRQKPVWGDDAALYNYRRFAKNDPPVGSVKYITWGLAGPHMCPGRWFAQSVIQIMTKNVLERFKFVPDRVLPDDEKYKYTGGSVLRTEVGVTVTKRG